MTAPSQMSNQADLQRALEMANRTSVRLDSHLSECTARYEAMVERGNGANGFGGNQRGADAAGGIVIIHEYSV